MLIRRPTAILIFLFEFESSRRPTDAEGLIPGSTPSGDWSIVFLQQMLNRFIFPSGSLESFDLFTQLCLLSLFRSNNLVDIFQVKPPMWTLTMLSTGCNGGCRNRDYLGKQGNLG